MLLDIVRHQSAGETQPLSYDPWTSHAITVRELEECAKAQGVEFRQGDVLLLRVGFIKKYYESGRQERDALADGDETLCVSRAFFVFNLLSDLLWM